MIDYLLLLTEVPQHPHPSTSPPPPPHPPLCVCAQGRLVYVGRASEAVSWFSSLGLPCRSSFCPTDHFLDVISMDYRSPSLEAHTRQRIHKLAQAWQSHMDTQAPATQDTPGQAQWGGAVEGLQRGSGFQASWLRQFSLLLGRAFKQAGRNKFAITVRVSNTQSRDRKHVVAVRGGRLNHAMGPSLSLGVWWWWQCCSNVFLALIVGALYSRHKDYHHLDQTMIQVHTYNTLYRNT